MTLAVGEALSPNTPNLDMTLAVGEALSPNKPNLDMTLAVGEALFLFFLLNSMVLYIVILFLHC